MSETQPATFPYTPGAVTHQPPPPPAPGMPDPEPFAHQPVPSESPRPHGPLAVVAIVLAIAALLVGVVVNFARAFIVASSSISALGTIGLVQAIIEGVLGLAALVLGFVALARGTGRRALAGTAIGVGLTIVLGVLGGYVYTGILTILSQALR